MINKIEHVEEDIETDEEEAEDPESTSKRSIASRENRWVGYSKLVALGVIAIVAAGAGFGTFHFVRSGEESDYKDHFYEITSELVQVCQMRANDIFENLEAFSALVTSQAVSLNQSWPYVVTPDFQAHAMVSNQITGAATLTIHPLVTNDNRDAWETFSVENYYSWMEQGHEYDKKIHPTFYEVQRNESLPRDPTKEALLWNKTGIVDHIWRIDEETSFGKMSETKKQYFPEWVRAPSPDYSPFTNLDMASDPVLKRTIEGMVEYDRPVLTEVRDASYLLTKYDRRFSPSEQEEPHSYLLQPIYDSLELDRNLTAFLSAFLRWSKFFENVLPEWENGIMVVLEGSCGQTFSYVLNGYEAVFVGNGDLHDTEYDSLRSDFEIAPFAKLEGTDEEKYCQYSARIYPSDSWKERFYSSDPYYYTAAVIACFLVTAAFFLIYDYLVQKRQAAVMDTATRSNAIVSNLFPSSVRDRLMEEAVKNDDESKKNAFRWNMGSNAVGVSAASTNCITSDEIFGSRPLAELFPESSILFADIAGFTSWSSEREPTQVFTLLETLYHAFDKIAKRRRVFKVETIGDCYVAVCGVPNPRSDHAIVLCKFARECLIRFNELVLQLETVLGPDTASLGLRTGIHSGPCTAGVLRGDKGRFQLFGDTMNTASRLESTGVKGKIQISAKTQEYLVGANKNWAIPREEKVVAKGKGELQTFWLQISAPSTSDGERSYSNGSRSENRIEDPVHSLRSSSKVLSPKMRASIKTDEPCGNYHRLVKWNVEILLKQLKLVIASRQTPPLRQQRRGSKLGLLPSSSYGKPIEEVKDVLDFPHFDVDGIQPEVDPDWVEIAPEVESQLIDYVTKIAASYQSNAFHNFEHGSHVTMSVTKLLSRIVTPNVKSSKSDADYNSDAVIHDHSLGLSSDPLAQFSCVLAALVHDVDHSGLPNSILISEEDPLAIEYEGKSVAEQHSLKLAWNLLMEPKYKDLQDCIFTNEDEYSRFRSNMVNLVLCTDIMDKELSAQRKTRWEKAFDEEVGSSSDMDPATNGKRKATIVLEYLMQASDVAHTMQHWHVYRKWNQRLFEEMYTAYLHGRIENDPSEGWYQGELGFFDFYVIPLAKKLERCGVFGVSSHEYLSYAEANRYEWEMKGESVVEEYLAAMKGKQQQQKG